MCICWQPHKGIQFHVRKYHGGPFVGDNKNRVPPTSCLQNKNKRVIDEMTRVDQSGATAADDGDVTVPPTNGIDPSPSVTLD